MDALLGLCMGVGLSAACGFRVFVPFLVVAIAARSGHIELSEGFQWVGSIPAIIAFASATALEVAAYYVPWLDNALDAAATPAAAIAGTIMTATCVGDMSPFMKWTLAVVAGGGAATAVQTFTVSTRAVSSATTAGIGNPVVSTAEATASTVFSIVAVVLPFVMAIAIFTLFLYIASKIFYRRPLPIEGVAGQPGVNPAGVNNET